MSSSLALALLLAGCTGAPDAPDAAPARPPDVLLVVLDTVRADRLSLHGYGRPTSLQLAEVAKAGVLFERAVAPGSWTWPVHASLFTGVPPWEHGAHFPPLGGDLSGGFPAPRADLPTLAERFSAGGYKTVSLSANCLLSPELGLVRGFDDARCLDVPGQVEAAAAEVLADRSQPLFLFVNLMSAHAPYAAHPVPWAAPHVPTLAAPPAWLDGYVDPGPPPGIDLQRKRDEDARTGIQRVLTRELTLPDEAWGMVGDLYDAGLVDADRRLMTVLGHWGGGGVIAVTSDHGEHLGERGLVDHRGSVYPEITHVPLVIAAPGRLEPGRRVPHPVSITGVGDTLLDLAGLEAPGPGVLGETRRPVTAMAWPDPYRAHAVGGRWRQTWRLYWDDDGAVVFDDAGAVELYDPARDPGFLQDRAAAEPDRAAALVARAAGVFRADVTGDARAPAAETEARLEALGYLEAESPPEP